MSPPKTPDRSRLRTLVPRSVRGPARVAVTVRRRVAALRTILRAKAFDREWYEAQTGLTFRSTERACWHYLRHGRVLGRSPHLLFEPSVAWPAAYGKDAAHDPLARHLRGEVPPSGRVHPGLASSWSATVRGRPAWLAWAADAGPDTPVPMLWSDGPDPLTWPEFRRQAIARAAETHRMLELRRDIRVRRSPPATAVEELPQLPQLPQSEPDADAPLVSVVLPTWNRASILRAAVASVVAQTLPNWELIIVDDGSDDDTLVVLEGLARQDARIRVMPLTHGGVCRARNHGLEAARGRWIAFLDSDNTWHPDFLQRIVAFAEGRRVPWAHAVLKMITDDGVRYRAFEGTREHLLVGNHIDLNVMIALREVFEEVGGFDETLRRAVDYDLVLRLSTLAAPSLAPFVGATYAAGRDDDQRISVAESFTWNAVVAMRHLIDVEAERVRPRVRGRVSIIVPVRTRDLDAAELVDALRGAAPDDEIIVVVAGQSEPVARGLAVAAVGSAGVRVVHWSADLTWSSCIDLGATHAGGEYLVAWRPNCVPVPGWWGPLREALEDTDTAVAQPLTLLPDGRVSSAGATFVPPDPFPSALLAGFPIEDARPLGTSRVPAAYAGVLALRSDDFWALGGIDPIFGSALGEVDLSLRATAAGLGATAVVTEAQVVARDPRRYRFAPDLSASARIMRLRHDDPPGSAAIWDRLGFEVVGRRVQPLAALASTRAELGASPVVRPVVQEHPRRLRWALDTAVPAGPGGPLGGDLQFADTLAASLRRLGQQVHVDRRDARMAEHRELDDVVLVLRGSDQVSPQPGCVSLMWVVSHPDLVTEPECAAYAQVFAASEHWARTVSERWGFPVAPLLHCTDPGSFTPDAAEPDSSSDVVFVGSRAGQPRSVTYATDAGMAPVVFGGGWAGVLPDERIGAEHVADDALPAVYASAGAVLLDHQDDTRHGGFIAPRVFDVLACGGRLLSDDVVGLSDLFGPAVRTFRSERDVQRVFEGNWRANWPDRPARLALADRVRSDHSFDARAQMLLDAAMQHVVRRSGS